MTDDKQQNALIKAMIASPVSTFNTALLLVMTVWVYAQRVADLDRLGARLKVVEEMDVLYRPRIDAIERDNSLQTERIQNTAIAIAQMRSVNDQRDAATSKSQADILNALGNIHEDLATLKALQSMQRANRDNTQTQGVR